MFVLLISFLSFFAVLARDFTCFILVSEYTPSDMLSEFSFLSSNSASLAILSFSSSILPALQSSRPHLIFDFTYSLLYQTSLRNFAIDNHILFFSSQEPSDFYSEWVFYLHPSPSSEAQTIKNALKYLNWTDFHLLTSESSQSKAIFSVFSSSPYNLISNSADQEVFDLYVSRIIKASGNWKVVVLSEDQGASKLLWGLEKSRILTERCGFVVSSKGWRGSKKLGTIGVVEEGLEDAQSEGEYEFKSILRAINILEKLTEDMKGPVVSNDILAHKLKENNKNNIVSEAFSIVNFKEDSKIIGRIEKGKVEMWEEIVFPGNVTVMNNSPPIVLLSANTRVIIDDEGEIQLVFLSSVGLQPMVSLVNSNSNIMPNFELELHETDCGYVQFDYNYASDCMKGHYDKIGAAHIASSYSSVIKSYLALFKEFNIEVPHITIGYIDLALYDKNLYPEVLVTIPDIFYLYIILPYTLKSFGWNNIILIIDDHIDRSQFAAFVQNAESLNLNILNPEDRMYIPSMKTKSYYEEIKHILQFIKDSKCRIIVIFTYRLSHLNFIEALYDFGYRRGELVLIYISRISKMLNESENINIDRDKLLELASGSLCIEFDDFVGEYGQELKTQIASLVDPLPLTYACYKIDALMLAVRTIDLMINVGRDFEDFQDLMYFMRGIRFTGCTGKVSIDSGGNGLSDIVYTIYNFYEKEGEEHEDIVGKYTFGVIVPLEMSKAVVWPDGTTEVPRDLIEETKCGFPDSIVKKNRNSQEISGIVTSGLFLAILIVTGFAWKQFENPEIEFLEEKRQMMFEDGVLLYFPLIETAQFIGLGPDFYNANIVLGFVSSLVCLDLDKLIKFEFEEFWTVLEVTLGLASLWCFSFFFTLKIHEQCLPRMVRDFLEVVGLTLIQVFSGAGFVGINVVLFSIFKCQKGIGEEITQSFLYNDCKTFCWEETHLSFLVGISVVIVIFNIFAISSRSIYDWIMEYVSVKVFPLYAFVKGIFQLGLVILNLHLKDEYPGVFSVVYCLLFGGWLLFLFHVDCYNYGRLNSWVRVFGLGVCAHQILMVGYTLLGIPDVALLVLQTAIIVVCAGVGFYYQLRKFPSMLFKMKGRNFDKLLKFTFTRRVKAKELTEHELDYVRREEYEIREIVS